MGKDLERDRSSQGEASSASLEGQVGAGWWHAGSYSPFPLQGQEIPVVMELNGSPDPLALLLREGGIHQAHPDHLEGWATHSATSGHLGCPAHSAIHRFPFPPTPSSLLSSLSLVYIIFLHIQSIHSRHGLCSVRDSHLYPKHHGWMGNRCSCPLKIYMKTTNSPLTGEINRSLQKIVKSSLLGNSVRVMHDPMATGIVIFLSTLKHHRK